MQDIETFDLEDFKYNSVNITAFRLVDVEDRRVTEKLAQMEKFQPIGHDILNRSGIIQVRTILFAHSRCLCYRVMKIWPGTLLERRAANWKSASPFLPPWSLLKFRAAASFTAWL